MANPQRSLRHRRRLQIWRYVADVVPLTTLPLSSARTERSALRTASLVGGSLVWLVGFFPLHPHLALANAAMAIVLVGGVILTW